MVSRMARRLLAGREMLGPLSPPLVSSGRHLKLPFSPRPPTRAAEAEVMGLSILSKEQDPTTPVVGRSNTHRGLVCVGLRCFAQEADHGREKSNGSMPDARA